MGGSSSPTAIEEMFRPPINRAMKTLDRSFFRKVVPLAAAKIKNDRLISKCRAELDPDLLKTERIDVMRKMRDTESSNVQKALLLDPRVKADGFCSLWQRTVQMLIRRIDTSTWTPKVRELVDSEKITIVDYTLKLDYEYWNYRMYVMREFPILEEAYGWR